MYPCIWWETTRDESDIYICWSLDILFPSSDILYNPQNPWNFKGGNNLGSKKSGFIPKALGNAQYSNCCWAESHLNSTSTCKQAESYLSGSPTLCQGPICLQNCISSLMVNLGYHNKVTTISSKNLGTWIFPPETQLHCNCFPTWTLPLCNCIGYEAITVGQRMFARAGRREMCNIWCKIKGKIANTTETE